MRKPFVYFSEAVLTPSRTSTVIKDLTASLGGKPSIDPSVAWEHNALAVQRQAQLYSSLSNAESKPKAYAAFVHRAALATADSITFNSIADQKTFVSTLESTVGTPQNYFVPSEVSSLLAKLASSGINWGVVSNESPGYQKVLAYHRLKPSSLLNASQTLLFKPLPRVWPAALRSVPVACRNDTWFIGSVLNPCDRMCSSKDIRCVLIDKTANNPEKPPLNASMRLVINDLEELAPLLTPLLTPSFLNLDFLNEPEEQFQDVKMTHFPANKLPPKTVPDLGISQSRRPR